MPYIPHTQRDIQEMLKVIGQESIESLFQDIPKSVRMQEPYKIPDGLTEPELERWMISLANKNQNLDDYVCFLGGGAYDHFIPVLVDYLTSRSEFWTSYTPYQPEASQGNLQAMFEYQTAICELTGMEIANCSLYDGPTALAEAVLLAYSHYRKKRKKIFLASTLHPEYKQVVETYTQNLDLQLEFLPEENGAISIEKTSALLTEEVAAVVVPSPNFYGIIEDIKILTSLAHKAGALMISVVNPISLGILESPGKNDVDIAVGDGQPLGIPMSFGGPSLGFFATKKEFLRKMPGRIVGETVDRQGKRGFVLTLQTREQHIRREKATSNICTNQALMALRALIYMVCLGKQGIYEVAYQCTQKAHYLAKEIQKLESCSLCYPNSPFFHEFVVRFTKPAQEILSYVQKQKIYAGIPLDRWFPSRSYDVLMTVTESRTRPEMDRLIEILKKI